MEAERELEDEKAGGGGPSEEEAKEEKSPYKPKMLIKLS